MAGNKNSGRKRVLYNWKSRNRGLYKNTEAWTWDNKTVEKQKSWWGKSRDF